MKPSFDSLKFYNSYEEMTQKYSEQILENDNFPFFFQENQSKNFYCFEENLDNFSENENFKSIFNNTSSSLDENKNIYYKDEYPSNQKSLADQTTGTHTINIVLCEKPNLEKNINNYNNPNESKIKNDSNISQNIKFDPFENFRNKMNLQDEIKLENQLNMALNEKKLCSIPKENYKTNQEPIFKNVKEIKNNKIFLIYKSEENKNRLLKKKTRRKNTELSTDHLGNSNEKITNNLLFYDEDVTKSRKFNFDSIYKKINANIYKSIRILFQEILKDYDKSLNTFSLFSQSLITNASISELKKIINYSIREILVYDLQYLDELKSRNVQSVLQKTEIENLLEMKFSHYYENIYKLSQTHQQKLEKLLKGIKNLEDLKYYKRYLSLDQKLIEYITKSKANRPKTCKKAGD